MGDSKRLRRATRAVPALFVRWMKGLLIGGSEMVLAICLVLLFALFLTGILVVSFPKGTALADFYADLVGTRGAGSRVLWQDRPADATDRLAVLDYVRRTVRDRPADAVAWGNAWSGMPLQDRHTIQTLARSAATVSFGASNELHLGERSLVVVKKQDQRRGFRRQRSSVVLLGGRIDGRIGSKLGGAPRLDVVMPGGTAEIRGRNGMGTDFSATVGDDESSTVNVYAGVARVKTPQGVVRVGPDEAITYDAEGLMGEVVPIPDPPAIVAPQDGTVRTFGAVAPRVRFRWTGPPRADAYRFVLSRDPDLEEIVYTGEIPGPEFVHGDLETGRYYWQVRTVAERAESRPSDVHEFVLVQDLDPPELEVVLPQGIVAASELVVHGRTEPGSELFIENEQVPVAADGGFAYALELDRGLNMIVVEAVDAVGNSAYRTQYVTARF